MCCEVLHAPNPRDLVQQGIDLLLTANQANLGYVLHPQFLSCLRKTNILENRRRITPQF